MTEPLTNAGTASATLPLPPGELFVGGEWVAPLSGREFDVLNPATEERITAVARADEHDVDRAVRAARAAFDPSAPWRTMSPADRARLIWRLGDLIEEHAQELGRLESLDNGKPVHLARDIDMRFAADLLRYMAGWATKLEGASLPLSMSGPERALAFTVREPVGVVGQIIPWNFPLLMASWKIAPALACGCTVVLKPAEQTPLTALRLAELVAAAEIPPGVLNVVTGYGDAGAAMVAHPGIDKVAFTGSTEVGKAIVAASAGSLKRVSLELGGKSPSLVFADADLDEAIPLVADAVFFNAGESCTAASRMYVERAIYDEVVDGVASAGAAMKIGAGDDPESVIGPLISAEHRERVQRYVDSATDDGAIVRSGGRAVGERGYFFEPTVITGTRPDMVVEREEIFGPVVCAIPFDTLEEATDAANDTSYGLAAGVFTTSLERAHRAASRLRTGTVWVNTYNLNDPALPFGGFKESGWGREMGRDVLENYLENKAVCIVP